MPNLVSTSGTGILRVNGSAQETTTRPPPLELAGDKEEVTKFNAVNQLENAVGGLVPIQDPQLRKVLIPALVIGIIYMVTQRLL